MGYVNLYTQTEYSFLNSSINLKSLVEKTKLLNHKAIAICDNSMHGVVKFYNACLSNNIKPIIGLRVEIKNPSPTVLLLYAINNLGYQNLLILASKKSISEIDYEDLVKSKNGILCVLAGDENDIVRKISNNHIDSGSETLNNLKEIYDNLYMGINLQTTRMFELLPNVLSFAHQNNIKLVGINKSNFLNEDDFDAYITLRSIDLGVSNYSHNERETSSYYLNNEEFYSLFQNYPDLIRNTLEIANICNVTLDFSSKHYPKYDSSDAYKMLENLCKAGLNKRLKNKFVDTALYKKRLLYELSVIQKMGFSDYFLIVYDYVLFAKKSNFLVGTGRGSAPGSLVSYCLGITDVDPIQYGLLFERFLNPERISMPDIDVDFPDDKRDEVIKYIATRFGKQRVAHISTYGTFGPRLVIRDVCRVLKIDDNILNIIIKNIPSVNPPSIKSLTKDNEELKRMYENNEVVRKLLDISMKLEGLPRHVSTHAAGIIMADRELTSYTPLQSGINGLYQTQFEASDLESLGLLKMDILGLRNLTIIDNIIKKIKVTEPNFDLNKISFEDKLVFDLIRSGDTDGVFQLESSGMRNVLRSLKVDSFIDIVHANALFRPGPMEMINTFVENKFSKKQITYLHPDLEEILKPTYGIIVFQEQIMLIATKFAGYTLGMADILRRAVSKKKAEELERERVRFIEYSKKNGYDEKLSNEIYNYIEKFANYGFNKSHSVSYSIIAYQMAYLKAYYYQYFMAVVMSNSIGSKNLISKYIDDCRKKNIKVISPSINYSSAEFEIYKDKMFYPLTGINGLGNILINQIISERENGKFESYEDFIYRSSSFLNKNVIANLVYSCALDEFGLTKKTMIENYEMMLQMKSYMKVMNNNLIIKKNDLDEYSFEEVSKLEFFALGFNLKYNLFINYIPLKQKERTTDLINLQVGNRVKVLFAIRSIKEIKTKNGKLMAFLELYDDTSSIEAVCFPNQYLEFKTILSKEKVLIGLGKVDSRDGKMQLVIENVYSVK